METLSSAATIMSSSCSRPSILSPKKYLSTKRRSLLTLAQHDGRNDASDLRPDPEDNKLVPFLSNPFSLSPFSKDAALGLVLSAATGRGWTTGSGMEGPSVPAGVEMNSGTDQISTFPWSLFTKSPRRRMRVAFTCNVCGQRTTRAINPHAYTDGTVFVQCCGCNVFHKLVDNLNLFHEMKCYVNPSFQYKGLDGGLHFKYLDEDDDNDVFPLV
ncbi:zim17-type zinc finger protein [Tasmannia lanceolata]|uniref:zim17-type zinc finger protein n=1 Tax=Tasmannia lanceolata TaxID=3420 RepID=UPI00406348E1